LIWNNPVSFLLFLFLFLLSCSWVMPMLILVIASVCCYSVTG
jgi:hypothetical protein